MKTLFFILVLVCPIFLRAQDIASVRYQNQIQSLGQQSEISHTSASAPGETMRKVGRGLTIGGVGLTILGVALMSSADEIYYSSTATPNGTVEQGDPKGALGLMSTM